MIWSELEIATLREESHPLLVRAGYRRGAEWLFLGHRALAKIESVLRQESDRGRALARCGVKYIRAGADFVVESKAGDDVLVQGTNYAELLGMAVSVAQPPAIPDPEGDRAPEEFHTPGVKTIAQIAEFTGLPATSQIKSLVVMLDSVQGSEPVLVLLRGDHQLSPAKLGNVRQAEAEEIRRWFGTDPGSLGPVGAPHMRIIADEALRGRRNMIAGANQNDYHLRNVTPGKDFAAEFADLRQAAEGDTSITDGRPLRFSKVTVLDRAERILEASVEQNRDQDGIILPPAIAPFTVLVTPVHPERLPAAREIHARLLAEGHDVLLDDRDARPGVKFKDADLIGIPYRINVGKKLAEGLVELVARATHQSSDVPVGEISIPR
jgi:prolyl-tRNA synthetase